MRPTDHAANDPRIAPSGRFSIRVDDLTGAEIIALLQEHLEFAARHSPAGCVHALDVSGLRSADVTFWSTWLGTELVGCGALKELDPTHGEIKSMRTASSHQRLGAASSMLKHILTVARQRGYRRLSLETGGNEAFAPARALYAKFGFQRCSPFADYVENSFSVCMTLSLDELSDDELLASFEDCSLPWAHWNHRAHVRVAYLYASRHDFASALNTMRSSIQRYNLATKTPEAIDRGYHETITHAFLRLVHHASIASGPHTSSHDFCAAHPELLTKDALQRYYTRERIMTWQAKQEFVEPDRCALP